MQNSLAQYFQCQKELYGRESLVFDEGFIIYKAFEDKSVYAHLIYIEPDKRGLGVGREMVNKLIEITGATSLHSYVDITTENPELSLQAHLGYGFKINGISESSIQLYYKTKEDNNG